MIVLLLILILCVLLFGASRVLDLGREVLAILGILGLTLIAITYGPGVIAWFVENMVAVLFFSLLLILFLYALLFGDDRPRATRSQRQSKENSAYSLDEKIDEDELLPGFKDTKSD